MQGSIVSREVNGASTVVKVSTENGSRKIYGVPARVSVGALVEYEMVTGSSGYPYAKYTGLINEAADDEDETETVEQATNTNTETNLETGEDPYYTVSRLNEKIESEYRNNTFFSNIWVKGEVTNYSGHTYNYYFDIKDDSAIISCIIREPNARRAINFVLERGQQVAIKGALKFYEKGGKTQIEVYEIVNVGEGAAHLRYLQLKERLTNEGLFDVAHHKEIPTHANRVGVLTSRDGKAIGDIMKVAREKNPYVQVVLYHVSVQGVRAVETMLQGIRALERENLDVIIIGRGGGSDEDLSVYDDERIVRAVFAANTPYVSAVGHQAHMPLVDMVVDARFATPTDAADHVVFNVIQEIKRVKDLHKQIIEKTEKNLQMRQMKLAWVKAEIEKNSPRAKLDAKKNRLNNAKQSMKTSMDSIVQSRKHRCELAVKELEKNSPAVKIQERFNHLAIVKQQIRDRMDRVFQIKKTRYDVLLAKLDGLSPTAKLIRGFGYISSDDKPVKSIENVAVGDKLTVRIHDGEISSSITSIEKKNI